MDEQEQEPKLSGQILRAAISIVIVLGTLLTLRHYGLLDTQPDLPLESVEEFSSTIER